MLLFPREIREELIAEDRDFAVKTERLTVSDRPMDRESTEKTVFLTAAIAVGVLGMHRKVKNVVGYSRNLGVVRTEQDEMIYTFSSRSELESQLDQSEEELNGFAAMVGADILHFNRYPGWQFEEGSEIRRRYIAAYEKLYRTTPGIEILHAGLECGVFKHQIPDLDLISCGPTLLNLHSPDEMLNVDSFAKFFALILEILGQ